MADRKDMKSKRIKGQREKERKRARKKNRKGPGQQKKSTCKVGNHFFVKINANLESLQPKN